MLHDEQNSPDNRLASEENLNKAIELLGGMHEIDPSGLRRRVVNTITMRKRRRRGIRLAKTAAAIVLPLLLAGGIWMYVGRPGGGNHVISRVEEDVKLILPDGSEIVMGGILDDADVARLENVLIHKEGGVVTVQDIRGADNGSSIDERIVKLDVPKGAQYDIVLADGTHVWLNSNSRLRFPAAFSGACRRVFLEGEGYFQVASDPQKPFIVEADGQSLSVLGTEFNIYAYPDEPILYTTLVEGSVSLKPVGAGQETILIPGQQSRLDKASGEIGLAVVDAGEITGWKDGAFVFEGNTLEQVMIKLARWYDIEFSFENDSMKSLISRGSLPIQDDISRLLRIIEGSGAVRFEIDGKHIKVMEKQ